MRTSALFCALVGLLAACSGGGTNSDFPMSFSVQPVDRDTIEFDPTDPDPGTVPPIRAIAAAGGFVVHGYFSTPCTRDPIRGRGSRRDDGTVHVRVWAERQGGSCPARPDSYTYEARVAGLNPGTVHLTVEHERDARRNDGVVLDTLLAID